MGTSDARELEREGSAGGRCTSCGTTDLMELERATVRTWWMEALRLMGGVVGAVGKREVEIVEAVEAVERRFRKVEEAREGFWWWWERDCGGRSKGGGLVGPEAVVGGDL